MTVTNITICIIPCHPIEEPLLKVRRTPQISHETHKEATDVQRTSLEADGDLSKLLVTDLQLCAARSARGFFRGPSFDSPGVMATPIRPLETLERHQLSVCDCCGYKTVGKEIFSLEVKEAQFASRMIDPPYLISLDVFNNKKSPGRISIL